MSDLKFKYKINELIDDLPKSKNTSWVATELEKEGIKTRTFYRDKSIVTTDEEDIPADRLLIYSKFFGVTIDELFNYTKRIKSAEERKAS